MSEHDAAIEAAAKAAWPNCTGPNGVPSWAIFIVRAAVAAYLRAEAAKRRKDPTLQCTSLLEILAAELDPLATTAGDQEA